MDAEEELEEEVMSLGNETLKLTRGPIPEFMLIQQ